MLSSSSQVPLSLLQVEVAADDAGNTAVVLETEDVVEPGIQQNELCLDLDVRGRSEGAALMAAFLAVDVWRHSAL